MFLPIELWSKKQHYILLKGKLLQMSYIIILKIKLKNPSSEFVML